MARRAVAFAAVAVAAAVAWLTRAFCDPPTRDCDRAAPARDGAGDDTRGIRGALYTGALNDGRGAEACGARIPRPPGPPAFGPLASASGTTSSPITIAASNDPRI